MSGNTVRLFVLGPSHYCERARWGLDHQAIAYVEERWAIGPHVPLARRAGAAGTGLPILKTGDATIQGSDRILDWAGLPEADPVLEARFDTRVAPLVRQFIYASTLGTPAARAVRDLLLVGVAPVQAAIGRLLWPAMRRLMVAGMDARPERLPHLVSAIDAELDWFESRLGGQPYLVGGAFGRADLTAASLLAPIARPPGRPHLPPMEPLAGYLARWAARPAVAWVLRTYAAHRHPAATAAAA